MSRCSLSSVPNRLASHSCRARRLALTSSAPDSETETSTCRPSTGCGARSTSPISASEAITRVIDGGRTRSRIARAPGVIGPSLASIASADSWDNDTGDEGFRNRSWRASLITASDRSLASRASLSGMARGYTEGREAGVRTGQGRVLILVGRPRVFHRTAYLPAYPDLLCGPRSSAGGCASYPVAGYVDRDARRTQPHRAAAAGRAAARLAVHHARCGGLAERGGRRLPGTRPADLASGGPGRAGGGGARHEHLPAPARRCPPRCARRSVRARKLSGSA